MSWTRFFRRRYWDEERARELDAYLEAETDDNIARGMSPEEARYAAHRKLGNTTLIREEIYHMNSLGWLESAWQDLRFAVRMLCKSPGFTAVVVLTLALGIGTNTAIFSLVDQLLLWTVPAHEPNRLVKIEGVYSSSYPFFCAYRDLNQVFSGVLASSDNLSAGIRPAGAPGVEVGHVEYVSGGYFQILGIGATAGRVIAPSDDGAPGGSPVAVLSYRYWQRRLAGDLHVIGRKLTVNTYPLVIVGVAEEGFGGLFNGDEPDAFVPLAMYPVTTPSVARTWNTINMSWLSTLARLKTGISIQQAQANMPVLWSQAVERVGDRAVRAVSKAHLLQKDESRLEPAARAPRFIRNQSFLDPIKVLAVATALLLLIACANVANLLLARGSQRWKETAVRLALGGTRARLIRQFLTESLFLATAGSAAGMALAYCGVRALAKIEVLDPGFHFRLSVFVLASCAGLSLLTSLLFGLVPALRATRMSLAENMKDGGSATQTISRSRLSKLLVVNQIALSLTLLVVAGLFGRTLRNLQHIDLGFQRENIAIFDVDPTSLGYRGQRLRSFYDELLEHARGVPGVHSAALSAVTPMSNYSRSVGFSNGSQTRLFALTNPVSSGYFTTMGIPLLLGRDFRPEDEPAVTPAETTMGQLGRSSGGGQAKEPPVCIISESLAHQLFGVANPVGHHLCYSTGGRACEHGSEILGVVKDVHYEQLTQADPAGTLYEPSWANGPEVRWLEVRFAGNATPIVEGVRRALEAQDPNVPLLRVRMMEEYVNNQMAHERLVAYLSSFFGVLALGLASVGLYGVLAHAVTQRTREIGIRMALGARQRDVVGMIVRVSIVPVLSGVAIGLAAAFSWSLFLGSLLYGVDSFDLGSVSLSVTVMLAAALLAAAIPAQRATRVDPMVALRYE
ncbi:MAG: ADOP family duplicated permease [Terriglobia bacterium]